MLTGEILLAAVLLTSPKEPAPPNAWVEALRPDLLTLAMDGEILDPREKGFVLGHDVAADLLMLQRRWLAMGNAPLIGEGAWLPTRSRLTELMTINRDYRYHYLTERLKTDLYNEDTIREAINDADHLYRILDTARDAECNYYYLAVRRQSLKLLRDLIGPEAFLAGEMPPHVPLHHLPPLDR